MEAVLNARCGRPRWRCVTAGCHAWLIVAALANSLALAEEQFPPGTQPAQNTAADSQPAIQTPALIRGAAKKIQYVGPDTFILLDAEGRAQPVPGMTYEDFLTAWKQSQNVSAANRRPRFVIESVTIDGAADERRAELKLELTVRLLTNEPVAVPLGLSSAIMQGQPRFAKGRESRVEGREPEQEIDFLEFNQNAGGWMAWLSGGPNERHTLSFDALVPLTHEGVETTLILACPRALVSKLRLEVRPAAQEFTATSGAVISTASTAGGTRYEITGLAGQSTLSWKRGAPTTAELSAVLAAAGAIQVSIDGRSVRTDARLTVQSYGGSFDRFRVRLPAGAKLLQENRSGSTSPQQQVFVEEPPPRASGQPPADERQTVMVQLREKQAGPVVVDLSTEQPLGGLDSETPLELAGFEVLGAVRQFGDIALRVPSDWQARWEAGRFVRQIDANELEARLRQAGLTAAFQYDRQPWSLGVRFAERRLRVYAAPQYAMECFPDEARLHVRLEYQVVGTRAYEFRVDLKGWELAADPIESGGLVDREQVSIEPGGTLVLPLAQASARRAEVAFVARRALPRDASQIRLPLPFPLAESIGTGELVVRSSAGVELTPNLSQSSGLTPTAVVNSPVTSQENAGGAFRFHCGPTEAVFAADRASRAREIATESLTRVSIAVADVHTETHTNYAVRYEPIQELSCELPFDLPFDLSAAEIVLISPTSATGPQSEPQETPLKFDETSSATNGQAADRKSRVIKVQLPQPRLGRFAVRLRAAWNRSAGPAGGALSLPLLLPLDGKIASQRVISYTAPELAANLDSGTNTSWQSKTNTDQAAGFRLSAIGQTDFPSADSREPTAAPVSEFVASRPEISLPLVTSAVDRNVPSATTVVRTWMQTWIAGNTRQDRAAFRFRTAAARVAVELPPEIQSADVEVLFDGAPVPAILRSSGRLVVPLPAKSTEQGAESRANTPKNLPALSSLLPADIHTLELRYRQTVSEPIVGRWRFTPPQMVAATNLSDVYWQVVLPGDRHILRSPELAPCNRWQWLGSFYGRRPTKSQAELEAWAGATSGLAPSAGQSEYLFSGLAPAASIELTTAPRWLVVMAASAVLLILAITWIYLPVRARSWFAATLACALAVLAVAFPTPAMLLGQASVVGAISGALAIWFARIAERIPRGVTPLPSPSTGRTVTPRPESSAASRSPVAIAAASSSLVLRAEESQR